ncbi:DUF3368 domain-containing protein [Spirulina sp. CCNP1310]|uniref:DUF3368 domain-containing protein n=1 Tax=Spirulina sp. CCNP1310 TaxID=3110249 RepID=UPI002B20E38E|nr:DUF3368 domain-containing protein [Spirulina sp. CCNP1310]MEA5421432.1 DUF3368 domain-containing protein [Spirulina sp. CCNP1310]
MFVDRIIINASPLIVLFNSEQEDLLPQLFSEIIVPEAVIEEVTQSKNDRASQQICETDWLKQQTVDIHPPVAAWDLGKGETSVISCAIASPTYCVMIDDRAARRCAKSFGIPILGTGRAIVLAKQRGLIQSVGERLKRLQDVGLYLSPQVIELLKVQANEESSKT